jgi:hypothetical protein
MFVMTFNEMRGLYPISFGNVRVYGELAEFR